MVRSSAIFQTVKRRKTMDKLNCKEMNCVNCTKDTVKWTRLLCRSENTGDSLREGFAKKWAGNNGIYFKVLLTFSFNFCIYEVTLVVPNFGDCSNVLLVSVMCGSSGEEQHIPICVLFCVSREKQNKTAFRYSHIHSNYFSIIIFMF